MLEQIEGKHLFPSDQVFSCPNGHQLLIRRLWKAIDVSSGPWEDSSRVAIGTKSAGLFLDAPSKPITFRCPSCPPDSQPLTIKK